MKLKIKEKAIELRQSGKTYSEISNILDEKVPKGTLSGWFKDIKLTPKQFKILKHNVSNKIKISQQAGQKVLREKRRLKLGVILSKSQSAVGTLDIKTQKIILSILYLGEGAKFRTTRDLRLSNSDPRIIQLYLRLLRNCYQIDNSKMRARIQIRFDQDHGKLEKFWKKTIGVSKLKFYPTYVDKRTEGKPTKKRGYMGVCTIEYFDTSIQLELEMLSQLITENILGTKIDNTEFVERWLK